MDMDIEIVNLRRIKHVRLALEAGTVTLLAGNNEAGKSSTVASIAALLSGQPLPAGMTKREAISLVHDGAAMGHAIITTATGRLALALPDGSITAEGTPPHASALAMGQVDLLAMPQAERVGLLAKLLGAEPTERQWVAKLQEFGIAQGDIGRRARAEGQSEIDIANLCADAKQPVDNITKFAEELRIHGWDNFHAKRQEKGREFKAAWKNLTGANYGSAIAAKWHPDGWTPAMEVQEVEDLQAALSAAEEALRQASIKTGVSDELRAEKMKSAAGLAKAKAAVTAIAAEILRCEEAVRDAKRTADALPREPSREITCPCPHCQKPVVVHQPAQYGGVFRLTVPETSITTEELARRRQARADADGRVGAAEQDLGFALQNRTRAETDLHNCEAAATWLEKNPATAGEAVDTAPLQAAVDAAKRALAMKILDEKAGDAHWQVEMNQRIVDALAPGGMRREALLAALDSFNKGKLAELCGYAHWHPIALVALDGGDIGVTYNGRPYPLAGESAKWRCRSALQIALADRNGDCLVALDGGDILANVEDRKGLIEMSLDQPFPVIVTMAHQSPAGVFDLAAKDLGKTYWLEGGVARTLAEAKAA